MSRARCKLLAAAGRNWQLDRRARVRVASDGPLPEAPLSSTSVISWMSCGRGYPMRIAQIAPLIESVPPRRYGGTERIVAYLTDELVRVGHDVTLFASGDSVSSANIVPCGATALRLDPKVRDPIPYYMLMLDRVREAADEFDILHFHIDQFHFTSIPTDCPPHGDDATRPTGPARSQAALSGLWRNAAGLDLEPAA